MLYAGILTAMNGELTLGILMVLSCEFGMIPGSLLAALGVAVWSKE